MINRGEVVKRIRDSIYKELGWDRAIISFSPLFHPSYRLSIMYFPELVFEEFYFPLDMTADVMVDSVMLSLTFR